jgi:RNA polymerase sigma factor (sigma-70 family)
VSAGRGLPEASEPALVALAMCGDHSAFAELVRRRQSWLRTLLRRMCRDDTLADDLAQQVLLRAWRGLPALRSVAAFGAWLRRLAVHAWLERRRQRSAATEPLDDMEPLLAAPDFDPGVGLDLDRALAQLADDVRLCIVLAYGEGMSHEEISTLSALPLGTVKSHIRRGSARLRALLEAYELRPEEHIHAE